MVKTNSRPMVMSTHGVITSGHYLATAAGYRISLQGGNAVDIAATVCFCLNVLDPQENTTGGEVPTLIYSAREKKVYALSGVGWAPRAFTIDWCRTHGIDLIPGDGYLPATIPSVVGSWALALQRFGTLSLGQVLQPAIELADQGFPLHPGLRSTLEKNKDRFMDLYPSTAQVYLPGGKVPQPGEKVRNPDLAATYKTLCQAEAKAATRGRNAGIQAACDAFYKGEIAERILSFVTNNPVVDASGSSHTALLDYNDLAEWQASLEEPISLDYKGLDVYKCPPWTQGPVFLQQLALLKGINLRAIPQGSAEYVHTAIECAKLAFADREAYYGDPRFDPMRFDVLLSEAYNARRRALIGDRACFEMRPGNIGHDITTIAIDDILGDNRHALGFDDPHRKDDGRTHKHDTTHLDVIDPQGNMVAATPSGAWIASSPMIPGVGFPLGTRGQMFYLNPARPNALAPHKRPRATLTPTLVTRNGEPYMAFGMRGGDVQDQISLQFFINHVEYGLDVQSALDTPMFWTEAFPSSFYPRQSEAGSIVAEDTFEPEVIEQLRSRGHIVHVTAMNNKVMGIRYDSESDVLMGGVCSTGETSLALGW